MTGKARRGGAPVAVVGRLPGRAARLKSSRTPADVPGTMRASPRPFRAALLSAAAAWLLVQPPMLPGGVIGAGTPIEQWKVLGRFDGRDACEKKRSDANAALIATLPEYAPPAERQQQIEFAAASRCVERTVDDPDDDGNADAD